MPAPTLRGLEGKVVLITGAGRGQGANHARAFAEAGCSVAALDICAPIPDLYDTATADDLALTAKEVEAAGQRCVTLVADIRDEEAVRSAVSATLEQLGRIDILINNAGMAALDRIGDMRASTLDAVIDTNLKGPMWMAKYVVPHMVGRNAGNVINISSAVTGNGNAMLSHYVASKYGVIGLTKSWAFELAEYGINVNAVCPATIKPGTGHGSGMVRGLADFLGMDPLEAYDMWNKVGNLPGPKWAAEMQDITDACLYLASDNARMVTGHVLYVDGGQATK
ncbi:SDR family NAD(P)-dependent oxidoreductase [Acidimicrobiaceae bacterium USS-CC1]|uniref:SDR family NAD(P)-dependent oxidoreductase n=1 Tax=Acidiferrimicrobium australe TaxID=2664430 RepID=A0ABW9QT18_9ACTN|nr:SDR family NAD(P)-dependent oxidoreductase [Acidiferrimicrobium australe]